MEHNPLNEKAGEKSEMGYSDDSMTYLTVFEDPGRILTDFLIGMEGVPENEASEDTGASFFLAASDT
jgi:hypothetical protein